MEKEGSELKAEEIKTEEIKAEDKKEEIYHDTFTAEEENALKEFKQALVQDKDFVEKYNKVEFLENNDELILFLRARKLNIKKAKKMIMDFFKWEIDFNLKELSSYTLEKEEEVKNIYIHGFHKTTKTGSPILYQLLAKIDSSDELFACGTHEQLVRYSTKIYQKMAVECFPACSKKYGRYIHELFSVIDLQFFGFHLFAPKCVKLVTDDLEICQNYFPECLGLTYVINSGAVFRALWKMIKPFLDDKTQKKVFVVGDDYLEYILKDIKKEDIPKVFGGECTCGGDGFCLWSDEGPWKDPSKMKQPPEQIIQKRKELVKDFISRVKYTAAEVEAKLIKKGEK